MKEDWRIIWSAASEADLRQWKAMIEGTLTPPEPAPSLEHILCRAIFSKDMDLIQTCLSRGAKLDDWVHESVGRNLSLALLQVLVPAGLNVNYNADRLGGYLTTAIYRGDLGLVRYLLRQGANPNQDPKIDRFPALTVAIQKNDVEMAEMLIQHGAWVNGFGALGMAAKYRRFEMMDLLIEHGADVNDNAKDLPWTSILTPQERLTALHEAALEGNKDVVAYLLERGANRNLQNVSGETPLTLAQTNGHRDVVELLQRGRV
ncbi:ankyrin [Aspergillus bertholletiae]|uniref:Ankyrin n=1 Tax=Aspergillus bertholletiae TaxID=1226010 RepID=A0A5N7BDA3_9EURO|nr:ankyrin [Aspergillus bertholletiae]